MKSNRRHLPISLGSAKNQRNPVRVDHPSSTPWSFADELRWAKPGLFYGLKHKGILMRPQVLFGYPIFTQRSMYIYIYTHYTVCNYKMCMCIVYYRYMVRIDDRSIFFLSHGKSQRSSRLSLLEATKKFPWNTWSS